MKVWCLGMDIEVSFVRFLGLGVISGGYFSDNAPYDAFYKSKCDLLKEMGPG